MLPLERRALPLRRFALVALLALLAASPRPVLAADPPTPQEVLVEESRLLRDLAVDADGFVERMEAWHGYAATIDEITRTLEAWKPLVDDLDQMRQLGQLGLFDLLADAHPALAFVGPLLEAIHGGSELLDRLGLVTARLVVLGSDLDALLTTPALSPDQMRTLRVAIPVGITALEEAAREYTALRPAIDLAVLQLDRVEQELRTTLADMLPLLDGLIGFGAGGASAQFAPQLDALLDTVFGNVRQIKAGLDTMADNAARDIATLRALETALLEAEAHHAFASAEAIAVAGDLDAAREAFLLVADTYANTRWASEASERARNPAGSLAAHSTDTPGGAPALAWILVVVLALAAAVAGWLAWSRRRTAAPPTA